MYARYFLPEQAMTERRILRRIRGTDTSDGAGVKLKRIIGQPGLDMLDPFLLLDEFRSDQAGDYIAGFPEHPHRGFETVTYMLAGHMQHGDNHGNRGDLKPGSVQWMTAGRGIVHSEMPQQENGLMWGFQLWVNLPAKDKLIEPRYQDIPPERIPVVHPAEGVTVKVIAGSLGDASGPVSGIVTAPVYLDIAVEAGAGIEIPTTTRSPTFSTAAMPRWLEKSFRAASWRCCPKVATCASPATKPQLVCCWWRANHYRNRSRATARS
jgi:hypothetical protein